MTENQANIRQFQSSQSNEIRIRHLAEINPSKSRISHLPDDTSVSFVSLDGFGKDGNIKDCEISDLGKVYNGYTYFEKGDIAIAKITPSFENGKGAICRGLENDIGFGSTELHILRPHNDVCTKFLWYTMRTKKFMDGAEAAMRGVAGQQRVPENFISNFKVPNIPYKEQQDIADFIDKKVEKINNLAEEKEKLSNLLHDKKPSLVHEYITKGLKSNRQLRDTEIPWVNKIPESWDLKPIRGVVEKRDEMNSPVQETQILSVVRGKGVIPYEERGASGNKASDDLENYQIVHDGDIVANRLNLLIGSSGVAKQRGICSPEYLVLVPKPNEILPEFASYLFRDNVFLGWLAHHGKGIKNLRKRVYYKDLRTQLVPVPPKEEQKTIVEKLNREIDIIDKLSGLLSNSVELLNKKETILISAAIEGQIDSTEYRLVDN